MGRWFTGFIGTRYTGTGGAPAPVVRVPAARRATHSATDSAPFDVPHGVHAGIRLKRLFVPPAARGTR